MFRPPFQTVEVESLILANPAVFWWDNSQPWNIEKRSQIHCLRPLKMINILIGRADDSNFKVTETNSFKKGLDRPVTLHVRLQICRLK